MDLEELYVDVPTSGKTGAEGKNSDGANTGEWHKRYPGFKPVVEYVGNFSASQSGMTPRKVGLGGCLNLGFIHSSIHPFRFPFSFSIRRRKSSARRAFRSAW